MQESFDRHIYRILLVSLLVVLVSGVIFYHFVEKFTWVNAYYFCVVTLATVGYGDIVPHTDAGKIFTTFYILAGVGIFTTFISYQARRRSYKLDQRKEKHNKTAAENQTDILK
jgi:hypothetical protein